MDYDGYDIQVRPQNDPALRAVATASNQDTGDYLWAEGIDEENAAANLIRKIDRKKS